MRIVSKATTKATILNVAAELFSENGYDSVSIKQICEYSKSNIAAVNYHFGSKKQLYRSIFKDFGKNHLQKLELLLDKPKTAEEFKLRFQIYLEQAISLIEEEPYVAKIIMRDGHLASKLCSDIFKSTFFRLYKKLEGFLREAQRLKIISSKTDTAMIIQIIDSILCSRVFEQKELKKAVTGKNTDPSSNKRRWARAILEILFDGFMERKK